MRPLRICGQDIADIVLQRLKQYEVSVLKEIPKPPVPPSDYYPHAEFDLLANDSHSCEHERTIYLAGGAVVFDAVVDAVGGCKFAATKRFNSYTIGPILVLHDDMYVDPDLWRPLNGIEALYCLALYPWIGSLRFYSPHTSSRSAQVFVRGGVIVAAAGGSGWGHHYSFALRGHGPETGPDTKRI
jgi:hypothetical protein